jgi:hypothetical protein
MKRILLLCIFLSAAVSHAHLGERSVSRSNLKIRSQASGAQFQVREVTMAGSQVTEYVSNDGTVFAVRWQGNADPDLTTVLDSFFPDYAQVERKIHSQVRAQRTAVYVGSQVVVQKFGHMRDLHGLAYVPSLVPTGVKVEELP